MTLSKRLGAELEDQPGDNDYELYAYNQKKNHIVEFHERLKPFVIKSRFYFLVYFDIEIRPCNSLFS
jgi:hypothetical protein